MELGGWGSGFGCIDLHVVRRGDDALDLGKARLPVHLLEGKRASEQAIEKQCPPICRCPRRFAVEQPNNHQACSLPLCRSLTSCVLHFLSHFLTHFLCLEALSLTSLLSTFLRFSCCTFPNERVPKGRREKGRLEDRSRGVLMTPKGLFHFVVRTRVSGNSLYTTKECYFQLRFVPARVFEKLSETNTVH